MFSDSTSLSHFVLMLIDYNPGHPIKKMHLNNFLDYYFIYNFIQKILYSRCLMSGLDNHVTQIVLGPLGNLHYYDCEGGHLHLSFFKVHQICK